MQQRLAQIEAPTQAKIDAALIACLRRLAARGRQLRLERESRKTEESNEATKDAAHRRSEG